ncbi:MAG TPA: cation:proton antiporter [Thermodesulfobacteriota bacterium]|nr:cation:proton antiporter [Thermodesulfobacteriota bacterium]
MQLLPHWIIILVSIIVLSRLAALVSRRFGIPVVTLQLLAGIVLGPSVLNLAGFPIVLGTWGSPSPDPLHTFLKILAEIGLIQLMFLAGLQTDWNQLKTILKPIFSVGVWTFILTALVALITTRLFTDRWTEAMAVSAIMAASSFGIFVYNMSEMKLLGSKVVNILTGAAILSGFLAILMMIASLAANYGISFGGFRAAIAVCWFLGKLIMFFAIAYFLTSRFLKLASKSGFQKRPRQMLIGYLLLVAAIYAWAAMHFGSFAAIGVASLGGALLAVAPFEVKEKIGKGFGTGLASLLLGLLFIVIGMEVDLREAGGQVIFLIVLLATVIVSKLVGVWISIRKFPESMHGRLLIMIGTLPQGEVGMVIAAYLFSRGLVNPLQFNSSITLVVVLTMIAPIMMRVSPATAFLSLHGRGEGH